MDLTQKIILEVQKIEKKEGICTPQALVKASKSITAPLHNQFEWDNDNAGEKYRVWQARKLIKTVTVPIENRQVHGFHNVTITIQNRPVQGYMSTIKILKKATLRQQVITKALKELMYWQTEYKKFTELDRLVNKKQLKLLSKKYVKK